MGFILGLRPQQPQSSRDLAAASQAQQNINTQGADLAAKMAITLHDPSLQAE